MIPPHMPTSHPTSRLFLLDGMALVYRAHFAFIQNPIRNSQGVNHSAPFGFLNTLLGILDGERPTHIGVAFDTAAPTPRHVKYPAYKAQREAMPEELAAAIPRIKALCRAFRIPVLELDGYEADDIIGTLVKRAEREDIQSFMVTPDKDFAQLVSDKTFIWRPGRKGNEHEILDLPAVLKEWEIERPAQVIDILGLWGDASDNIPGMPGVGEKTAKKLIARFGSIENLLDNATTLTGKQRENAVAYADQILLSKDLATIITDAPVVVTWDDLVLEPRDDDALRALLEEFEFRGFTRRLFPAGGAPAGAAAKPDAEGSGEAPAFGAFRTIREVPHHYQIADTPERRARLAEELLAQPSFCFDIETTGLDRFACNLLGVAFSWQAHQGWFVPARSAQELAEFLPVFASTAEKVGHNLKFDLAILRRLGIVVEGPFFDTMLVDAILFPDRRHGMDYLSETLLGYTPVKLADLATPAPAPAADGDLFDFAAATKGSKDLDMAAIPVEQLAEYAAEDADVTWQLAAKLRPLLDESAQEIVYSGIEAPLLPVLVRMEMEGIAVDCEALAEIGRELQVRIDELAATVNELAGTPFNLASPKQLGQVLFEHLKLGDNARKTKTGQFRTDEQTLATLEGKHPIITAILGWREATKLKGTYLDALPSHIVPATGRIHTHFHQLVAATGRLASSDPNLQNIPVRSEAGRRIRRAFVPRTAAAGENYEILSCDYSQVELRIMAALANDTGMIAAFRAGEDIHASTAARIHDVPSAAVTPDLRRTAKMVNFGIIYGISAFGLAQRLGIPRSAAAGIIDAYFREYPAIREFMERTVNEARERGYVSTLGGRRRAFPDLDSNNQTVRSNAERAAINTPIQGTAADMIKMAMIRIDELLRSGPWQTRMLLQVHDELVFDLATSEKDELVPKILRLMQTALPLPHGVPVEVEWGAGPDWLAAH